jgi:hypothetical protein
MPNVQQMAIRLQSHMARVGNKAMDKEFKRIDALFADDKVSRFTRLSLRHTAPIRLAYIANNG